METEEFLLVRELLRSFATRHRMGSADDVKPTARTAAQEALAEPGLNGLRATARPVATVRECALLAEEHGAQPLTTSLMGTILLAPELIRLVGGQVLDGTPTIALAPDLRFPSADPGDRRAGLTLLVVEDGMPGFTRGRVLDKLGIKTQDTVEPAFDDVRVPVANRLGEEGAAFGYLGHNLPQERITVAVGSVAQTRAALDTTIGYVKERKAFGRTVASFQNTKFELASVAAELEAAQTMLDRAVLELVDGRLSGADAAKVKLFCTETQARAVDRCLQLFGGYGYMLEYPIARLYADARITRIYAGTSEVMKVVIAKSLGL
ncbi:acyl-CoA dehydrogenase family protein [Streptomyces sp. NBC_01235]|uniref:acyl-CoA dehydrogenase family protein n=1 Tax=Streptomyces sp. NBC_01235 TaxID=2903788 RepID=UPI002E137820|nr:acyl-CoA dehydrogenase family protein [Streptomyces sp. NBC_01235]